MKIKLMIDMIIKEKSRLFFLCYRDLLKRITLFLQKVSKKPKAISLSIYFALLIVRPITTLIKQKQSSPAQSANKQAKNKALNAYNI